MSGKLIKTEALLTITTGILLCSMDDVYEAMAHLAGFSVWTHQMPRVATELSTELEKHLPWLKRITLPEPVSSLENEAFRNEWLAKIKERHGATHELPAILSEFEAVSPVEEAASMFGVNRVITI